MNTNQCGDCIHWMCRECPEEKRIKGRWVGPSCATIVPVCILFERYVRLAPETTKGEDRHE